MKRSHHLRLHEEVLLLALHDEKGTLMSGMVGLALGGAGLAELLLEGRLRLVEGSRKRVFVEVADPTPLGDPLLDEWLERVATAKRRAVASAWVSRFGSTRRLRHRAAERLVEMRLLTREEGRLLGIFPRTTYPTANPAPERRLVAALRDAVAGAGEVDPRLALLVCLTHDTGMLRRVLGRDLLRRRKARLKALARMEGAGRGSREALQAAQEAAAAVAAATVAAAAAAAG